MDKNLGSTIDAYEVWSMTPGYNPKPDLSGGMTLSEMSAMQKVGRHINHEKLNTMASTTYSYKKDEFVIYFAVEHLDKARYINDDLFEVLPKFLPITKSTKIKKYVYAGDNIIYPFTIPNL